MTESALSPADILHAQLSEILVEVPISTLSALTVRQQFEILDWVEAVKDAVAEMRFVPCPEFLALRYLTHEQKRGAWTAFTHYRPAAKLKAQASLFGD